jgi:hypothetical protein
MTRWEDLERDRRSRERPADPHTDRDSVGPPTARSAPLRRTEGAVGQARGRRRPETGSQVGGAIPWKGEEAQESHVPAARRRTARRRNGLAGGAKPWRRPAPSGPGSPSAWEARAAPWRARVRRAEEPDGRGVGNDRTAQGAERRNGCLRGGMLWRAKPQEREPDGTSRQGSGRSQAVRRVGNPGDGP